MSKLQSKSQKTYMTRGITGSLGIMALSAVTVGVANGADSDAAEDTLINKGLGFIETLASEVAEKLAGENLKHLDISLIKEDSEVGGEFLGVYQLSKQADSGSFLQFSASRLDERSTGNIGLGRRFLIDEERILLGANLFYDVETTGDHDRMSLGLEALTPMLDTRFNYYRALSDTKTVGGVQETALDGYDARLSYQFDYMMNPEIFYRGYKWRDGKGFKESGAEIGLGLRLAQHTYFNLSTDDSNRTDRITKASLTYSVPLGVTAESTPTASSQSVSMAEKLFIPVKRENRIRKQRLTLGVVAVGR